MFEEWRGARHTGPVINVLKQMAIDRFHQFQALRLRETVASQLIFPDGDKIRFGLLQQPGIMPDAQFVA